MSYDAYSRKITANGIDKCNLEFTQTANPKLYDVVEIGEFGFVDCSSLVSITIPSSVRDIRWCALRLFPSLFLIA